MKNLISYIFLFALISCGGNADIKKSDTKAANTRATPTVQKTPPVRVNQPTATQRTTAAPPQADASNYKAKNEGWMVSLDKAYDESKKTGKPIMANFTGSDWCGWCKRLDKSVFHQPGFEKWAKDNVVLLELDFPRRFRLPQEIAAQNRNLQQSLGVRGYPTIWVFDADKDAAGKYKINAIGKTGYTKTLSEFQSTIGKYLTARG